MNKYDPENSKIGIHNGEELDFEASLKFTGFGKYNIFVTVACGLCLFTVNTSAYSIGYMLPAAECDLKLNTSEKGLLTAVRFIGVIVSLYFWGALADSQGRRKVILISLIGSVLSGVATVLTPSFWLFAVFLFLNGAFISGTASTIYAYLGEFHSNAQRARAIAWCTISMTISLITLPLIAWITISQTFSLEIFNFQFHSWRLFLLLCNMPGIFAAIAIGILPESPKYLVLEGRVQEAFEILKKIHLVNTRKTTYPVQPLPAYIRSEDETKKTALKVMKKMCYQTVPLFHSPNLKYTMITCWLQFGAFAISSGLLLWYPYILNKLSESYRNYPDSSFTVCEAMELIDDLKQDQSCDSLIIDFNVYLQNVIIGIAYCIGCSLIGCLINLVEKRWLLVANLLVPSVSCIILTVATSSILVDVLFVLVLVPSGLCVPIIHTAVVDIFPTHNKAMAISMSLMMGWAGSVVASYGIGYLLELSCNGTFYIYAAVIFGCVCLSLSIPNNRYA